MQSTELIDLFANGCVKVAAAVREFGVPRSTLYELMAEGRLQYTQLGRARLIPRLALARLLAEGLQGQFAAKAISEKAVPNVT
jgi:excisionase family DNA binding protein